MKEKRILAMFITSAITLVASLAVTFGVLMTLADPVPATGLTRYNYVFNAQNDLSLIVDNGDVLSLREEIVFQPTKSVEWTDNEVVWFNGDWFNGNDMQNGVVYADESVSSKIKVIPVKIKSSFEVDTVELQLFVNYDLETILGQFTFVKIWSTSENRFIDYNTTDGYIFNLKPGQEVELAIVVYADESDNLSDESIDWGNAYESINVKVFNNTVKPR